MATRKVNKMRLELKRRAARALTAWSQTILARVLPPSPRVVPVYQTWRGEQLPRDRGEAERAGRKR
ncbi:MAG: hypothetical protein QHH25_00245 [Candidatus Acetothermia bacterium]|jgi:hypothetical protein|nr:hypothetical protein [Candidatus Acetothermia bacterium]